MNLPLYSERRARASASFIRSHIRKRPAVALVLGSGLGHFADRLSGREVLPVATIPHYPRATVTGHHGNIVAGTLRKIPLLILQGRIHYYETGDLAASLFPVRVLHALGIRTLILTNAAGAVNPAFVAGDLMLITDHINLTFEPLPAPGRSSPHRTELYEETLRNAFLETAARCRIRLRTGVYCGLKGPSYETAAEIGMIRKIGGDAVGMSTVNEASLARDLGMRVAGISCITNLATGLQGEKLTHEDVTIVARRVRTRFSRLLSEAIPLLA
jgi:purine-nucleoside phosphorylase